MNDLIYFSFTALTTVGYGDLHPIHPVVRSLAVTEALVGHLYLAILISSLVGMALQQKVETGYITDPETDWGLQLDASGRTLRQASSFD